MGAPTHFDSLTDDELQRFVSNADLVDLDAHMAANLILELAERLERASFEYQSLEQAARLRQEAYYDGVDIGSAVAFDRYLDGIA
jgi:hypothetical protein